MASIKKRPNGSWRVRWRDHAGKEHAKHFKRQADAINYRKTVESSMLTGTYIDPRRGRTKFRDAAQAWLDGRVDWKKTTRTTNQGILNKHVLPAWSAVPVEKITTTAVQEWVTSLSGGDLSPRTVRKIFAVFSGVMTYAVTPLQLLPVAPTKGIRLPDPDTVTGDGEGDRRYLTAVEVEELAEACGPGRVVVLTLAYTGIRWGEMAGLQWKDVNTDRRRLTIRRAVGEVDGRLVWSTPKNRKTRTVPMPDFIAEELAAVAGDDDSLVFPAPRGGVLRSRAARRAWFDPAVDELGLFGLTPHALRHTAASLAVASGASVLTVCRMLGHSRPSVTLDVYADLFDGDLDEIAGRLSKVRADAQADRMRTAGESTRLSVVQ